MITYHIYQVCGFLYYGLVHFLVQYFSNCILQDAPGNKVSVAQSSCECWLLFILLEKVQSKLVYWSFQNLDVGNKIQCRIVLQTYFAMESFLCVLLLLLLSRFSCVQLCVTPSMAAHQAPPSLGFSRQEHWSGLPFPSPMHESENWTWSHSVVSNS